MKRIMVIGSCGAGKSTFSYQLAEKTKLPIIHLDKLYWKSGWVESDKKDFQDRLTQQLETPEWITDGNYSSTFYIRMPKADTIFWLDYPMPLCVFRVLKRYKQHYNKVRPDMAPGCPEEFDWQFLHFVITFPLHGRKRIIKALKNITPTQTLHHFKSPSQTKTYLTSL